MDIMQTGKQSVRAPAELVSYPCVGMAVDRGTLGYVLYSVTGSSFVLLVFYSVFS